jgi:hypothetical protein
VGRPCRLKRTKGRCRSSNNPFSNWVPPALALRPRGDSGRWSFVTAFRKTSIAAASGDLTPDWLFDGKYPISGEKFSVRNSTNGALFLGRRLREMLLPLSYRWQPNIATTLSRPTMTSTSLHPPLPPALQSPIALPIFSRSSAVGSRFIELMD